MKTLLFATLIVAITGIAWAAPVAIPVHVWVEGTTSGSGSITASGSFLESSPGAADGYFSSSVNRSTTGPLTADLGTDVYAEPGEAYDIAVSSSGISSLEVKLVPLPGYYVEIEGQIRSRYTITGGGTVTIRVLPRPVPPPRYASTPISSAMGKIDWRVALGALRNGSTAGELALIDSGYSSSWAALFTPGALSYESDSPEIQVYRPSGTIRQILANEAAVDVVTLSSTAYELRFYSPEQIQGTSDPRTFTGQPYAIYKIEQGDTSTSLKFTRSHFNLMSLTGTTTPAARTEIMTIKQTGTWPNAAFLETPWTLSGSSALTERSIDSSGTNPSRTENVEVRVPGSGGAVALRASRSYTLKPWGEALMNELLGTTQSVSSDFVYHENTSEPGSYGYLKSKTDNSGNWEGYEYYDPTNPTSNRAGTLRYRFRPFVSSPTSVSFSTSSGEVTEYDYSADVSGAMVRPALSETRVNGVVTARTTITYSTDTANSMALVVATRRDKFASGTSDYLETVTQYYSEAVSELFYRQQIHSVVQPGGIKSSYAHQRGTWNAWTGTFTLSGSNGTADGSASRTTVVHGTTDSAGASLYSAEDGYVIDPLYLVDGKSTKEVTTRNSRALVVRTETFVRDGSAWTRVAYTNFGYSQAAQPLAQASSNGASHSTYFDGRLLGWKSDQSGAKTSYTYDVMGRVDVRTREAAGTTILALPTSFIYDAAGRATEERVGPATGTQIVTAYVYDDAGRVTSTTSPGLAAVTTGYNVSSRTRTTTRTADSAYATETYNLDGSLLSVAGTAVVPSYYSYGVEGGSDGRRYTRVDTGSSSSDRWQKSWTDWLGRSVRTERPGFTGQANLVAENFYDASSGRLFKATAPGASPTRYEYDTLGQLKRSGLDVNDNGLLISTGDHGDRVTDTTQYFQNDGGSWWLRTESRSYTTLGDNTKLTPASINRSRLTGLASGRISETEAIDPEGNTTTETMEVNTTNKTATITTTRTGVTGNAVRVVTNGFTTSVTGHDGLISYAEYDALLRNWRNKDPRGKYTTTAFVSGTTMPLNVTDAASNVIATYAYDSLGRVTSVKNAQDDYAYTAYNERSQVLRQWGAATMPVEYIYDPTYGDQLALKTFQGGTGWTVSAWPGTAGNTSASPGTADFTKWVYDGPSGLLKEKYDGKNLNPASLDSNGVATPITGAKKVSFTYDSAGRPYQRTLAANGVATYGYSTTTGELTSVSYSGAAATNTTNLAYEYTRLGQLKKVDDATGARAFEYDPTKAWRLTHEEFASSTNPLYGTRFLSRQFTASGIVGRDKGLLLGSAADSDSELKQTYGYLANGRFETVASEYSTANTRTFTYDYFTNTPFVHHLTVSDGSFGVTRSYDENRDLLTGIDAAWGSTSRSKFEYTHNALGQRITAKQSGSAFDDYGASTYQQFEYNARGELTSAKAYLGTDVASIADPLPGRQYEFAYDNAGNRSSANSTGNTALRNDYFVNAGNQYTSRENNSVSLSGTAAASANVVVSGQTSLAPRQGAYWGFDVVHTESAATYKGFTFHARASGGSTVRTETRSLLLPPAAQTITYDDDGNLTNDGVWVYTYDGENRLLSMTSVTAVPVAARKKLEFKYDYLGRRVEKKVTIWDTGTETWKTTPDLARRYLYDGWNLVAEYNALSTLTLVRSYTWGLDLAGSLTATGGVGALLQITHHTGTPKRFLPTYDGNGNLTALVNGATGAVAARYEYSPFGETIRAEAIDSDLADQPFRFSTKFTDTETGLIYYGHRYYSPSMGRFINRDPSGEAGGINLYGFCGNNGVNRWDVLGLTAFDDFIAYYQDAIGGGRSDSLQDMIAATGIEYDEQTLRGFGFTDLVEYWGGYFDDIGSQGVMSSFDRMDRFAARSHQLHAEFNEMLHRANTPVVAPPPASLAVNGSAFQGGPAGVLGGAAVAPNRPAPADAQGAAGSFTAAQVVGVINSTPTGALMIAQAKAKVLLDSSNGSYTDSRGVHLDKNLGFADATRALAHEIAHAWSDTKGYLQGDIRRQTRDAYINTQISNEVFADVTRHQIYSELTDPSRMTMPFGQQPWQTAGSSGAQDATVRARYVGPNPVNRPSTNPNQTYTDYYGKQWDEARK